MIKRDYDRLRALRSRALPLLLALMSIALVAAGCGGEEESEQANEPTAQEEYVEEVQDAIAPIATQSEDLVSQASQARRVNDLAQPLGEAEEVYRTAAEDLEQITPPEDVQDLHEQLVAAQEDIADAADRAERAAERGNEDGIEAFRNAGDQYREAAEGISAEFQERGYDFGQSSGADE